MDQEQVTQKLTQLKRDVALSIFNFQMETDMLVTCINFTPSEHYKDEHGNLGVSFALRRRPNRNTVSKWKWFKIQQPRIKVPIFVNEVVVVDKFPDTRPVMRYHLYKPTGRHNRIDGYEYKYCGDVKE